MLTAQWHLFLRRLCAGALAMAVALPGIAVVLAAEAAAAAPAGCDANRDGNATGSTEDVFTDGTDAAADRLETDTGLTLSAPRPAYQWRVTVCVEVVDDGNPDTPDRFVVQVGAPVEELRPEAGAWERAALEKAVGDLTPHLFRPGARTSPHVDGVQFVGVEMWLAVDPAAWVPFTTTATVGEVSVTATATPSKMVWEFSDGVTKICDGPGVAYTPGAPGPAPCGRGFDHTSEVQPVTASVSIEYTITWSSSLSNKGTLTKRGEPNRYDLVVGEVQTYLTEGERRAREPIEALPDPESSQPINDDHCGWGSLLDCSLDDLVDAAVDFSTDILLPGPVKEALEKVWDFLKGCAAFVGDTFGSVKDVFAQIGQFVTDASGFIREKLDVAKAMYDGIRADPVGFSAQVLGDAVELDLLKENWAQWAGKVGCELAVGILTGGAAASGRFSKVLGDFNKFVDKVRDWLRRRDNDHHGDADIDLCPASSFPTGTQVLLADGSRRPIEAIRPGDAVWAFDPRDGSWEARPVAGQWSYVDTDEMATLRLGDGSTVSATDHHLFGNAGQGEFDELERLTPGERLATPDGQVLVDSVTVWPSAPTLVWELTVAVDHTFAVFAGDTAIAVHNACGVDPPDTGRITDKLEKAGLEGISVEDVQGAWARYVDATSPDKRLTQDQWLDKYVNIRRNAGVGGAYEREILDKLDLEKNNTLYPPDDPTFIPDAVRSDDPPRFVEMKNYEKTPLQPASNAGEQVRYLTQWAEDNPDGGRPSLELWISNDQNLSRDFKILLNEAVRAGVDVKVNDNPWVP